MTSSADSDEEGFSLSRSPSDVLAYKEVSDNIYYITALFITLYLLL